MVWGRESFYPEGAISDAFDGGVVGATRAVYASADEDMPQNLLRAAAAKAINSLTVGGEGVTLNDQLHVSLGMANFSSTQTCTGCTCISVVDTYQPFLDVVPFETS